MSKHTPITKAGLSYTALLAAAEQLEKQNDELLEALRAVEWAQNADSKVPQCPWCRRGMAGGHRENCQRQAAIARAESGAACSECEAQIVKLSTFHKYVKSFYGPGGVYDMSATDEQIVEATTEHIKSGADFEGDSVDRESVRDIMIERFGLKFPKGAA